MKLAAKKKSLSLNSSKKLTELVEALLKIDQNKAVEEKPKAKPEQPPEEGSKIFKNIDKDLNQIFQPGPLPDSCFIEENYTRLPSTKELYLDNLLPEHPEIKLSGGYKDFFFKECDKIFKGFDESVQHKTASDRIRDMLFAVGMDNTGMKRFFDKRYDPGWYNKL